MAKYKSKEVEYKGTRCRMTTEGGYYCYSKKTKSWSSSGMVNPNVHDFNVKMKNGDALHIFVNTEDNIFYADIIDKNGNRLHKIIPEKIY